MEKYGFVYLWRDKKHNRYYIGSHWGLENDGYVCSSRWMRNTYKRRPEDFKRKVISRIYTNRQDLLEKEFAWLQLIKNEELGTKYYNLTQHLNGHWSSNDGKRKTIGEKISASPLRAQRLRESNLGKKRSEYTKQRNREANKRQFENLEQREIRKQKTLSQWQDPEYLEKQRIARSKPEFYKSFTRKGKSHSKESIEKLKATKKANPTIITDDTRQKLSLSTSNLIWINNGSVNKRINKNEMIPEGFCTGRFGFKKGKHNTMRFKNGSC